MHKSKMHHASWADTERTPRCERPSAYTSLTDHTAQHSGLVTRGKTMCVKLDSADHPSDSHPAISEALVLHPMELQPHVEEGKVKRGEQQTPQATGREFENVRRVSQTQFCLICHRCMQPTPDQSRFWPKSFISLSFLGFKIQNGNNRGSISEKSFIGSWVLMWSTRIASSFWKWKPLVLLGWRPRHCLTLFCWTSAWCHRFSL